MGFESIVGIQSRSRYEKLNGGDDHEKLMARPRRRHCWVKKMNGGVKGLRLSRSRRLTFKALSVILMPSPSSRIAKVYAHIIDRIKIMDDLNLYPNIIFSSHLGLPVLSHPLPSVKSDRRPNHTTVSPRKTGLQEYQLSGLYQFNGQWEAWQKYDPLAFSFDTLLNPDDLIHDTNLPVKSTYSKKMRGAYRKMWLVVPCTSKKILRTESRKDIEEILKSKLGTIQEDEAECEVENNLTPTILGRSKKRSSTIIRKKGHCFVAHFSFKNRMPFMTSGMQAFLHRDIVDNYKEDDDDIDDQQDKSSNGYRSPTGNNNNSSKKNKIMMMLKKKKKKKENVSFTERYNSDRSRGDTASAVNKINPTKPNKGLLFPFNKPNKLFFKKSTPSSPSPSPSPSPNTAVASNACFPVQSQLLVKAREIHKHIGIQRAWLQHFGPFSISLDFSNDEILDMLKSLIEKDDFIPKNAAPFLGILMVMVMILDASSTPIMLHQCNCAFRCISFKVVGSSVSQDVESKGSNMEKPLLEYAKSLRLRFSTCIFRVRIDRKLKSPPCREWDIEHGLRQDFPT
ncbi:unnamed protein product [Dovyalis caffra]|uniref:Uncharacterized protein n=1 Tax=Dovyalis caffra TaxID=77055 RepID=A0AAV1RX80_9ROSI|nr:unnamed protein product [Dovyalis caffra]